MALSTPAEADKGSTSGPEGLQDPYLTSLYYKHFFKSLD